MKTADFAIQRVYSLLKTAGVTKPVYKLNKPAKANNPQYIVINSLPISSGVLQKVYVNVNYHVKDLREGIPDLDKLESYTSTLLSLLEDNYYQGIKIEFDSQNYIKEDSLGEHYSNIRLSVKIIN